MAQHRSTTTATGRVHGTTILLDAPIALPEDTVVRIVLEPIQDEERTLPQEAQAKAWREWVERGPQGPIDLEDDGAEDQ